MNSIDFLISTASPNSQQPFHWTSKHGVVGRTCSEIRSMSVRILAPPPLLGKV